MIDIRYLREHPELVKAAAKNKKAAISAKEIDQLIKLDENRRQLLGQVEDVRRERNELSAQLKGGKPQREQIEQGKQLKDQLAKLEEQLTQAEQNYTRLLKLVPNIPTEDVP